MKKPAPKFIWLFGGVIALAIAGYFSAPYFGEEFYKKGIKAKNEWRLQSAISYFSWAEKLSADKTNAQFEKALCYQLHGDFLASESEFEKLLAGSLINQKLEARILNSNGVNLFNQNNPDRALVSHQESLKIARLINDKKLQAQALVDLSRVLYHTKGKFDEAKTHLENALEIGRELNDELIIADALRNIGVVLWWGKGELDRPLGEYYEPALALYRKNGDWRSEATMLSNISLIYSFKGDGFQYMKLQNESFAIREKIGDQAGLSESYKSFGTAYSGMRNFRKGREYLVKSYELSKKIGFRLMQNEAETHLAGVYLMLGEYDEAIVLFRQILEREKTSPELAQSRRGSIAYCYLLKGDFQKAREIYGQILEIELKNDSEEIRSMFPLYVYLGETHRHLGEFEKAEDMLRKARDLSAKYGDEIIRGNFDYYLARAELSQIKKDYEKSFQFLKKLADDELNIFASSGTNIVNAPLPNRYDRLFSLLLEKLNKKIQKNEGENNPAEELAFRFLEQRRYRSFRNFIVQSGSKNISSTSASENEKAALAKIKKINEEIKSNNNPESRKRLQKAYSNYENAVVTEQFSQEIQQAITAAHPVDLKTAQKKMDEETALIEYIFVGEETFALVLTKNDLRSFALPVTRLNLKNKIRILQSSMFSNRENTESPDWQPITQSLRESLIEPFERSDILENVNRLAIVPFSFLHDLPFAALTKNENNQTRFLIEDYILFFPPSATFLTVNESTQQTKKLISFGRNSSDKSDLPPLKFAVEESRSVAEIFSGDAILENDANETEFKNLAAKATYLHLATHAFAEPDMPLFSRLILQSTEKDDGDLTTKEIFELGMDAELVTIAACEGAKSFSADSEGLIEIDRIGLTEAFLHAGSKSVLASLSPASDKATTDLMKSFYTNLLSKDKAKSLALAQREMLQGKINDQLKHPRYWANFVLIGTDR